MTHPPPTLVECREWVSEHCETLLLDSPQLEDVTMALESVSILVGALDAPTSKTALLRQQLQQLKPILPHDLKNTVAGIHEVCKACAPYTEHRTFVDSSSVQYRHEQPRILPQRVHYASVWPDQMDADANWFRQHFVGKPYLTLIGPIHPEEEDDDEAGLAIISVVREHEKEFGGRGQVAFLGSQYRVIVRTKEPPNGRFVVHESTMKETMLRLESAGQVSMLDYQELKQRKNRRPLRSFSSAILSNTVNAMAKSMRAAVLSVCPYVDLRSFKELSAEATILAGLEKEFLRFDEMDIPRSYKFGVLTIRDGQSTEEEWFSNSGLSRDLEHLLGLLGRRVELCGFKGYTAGLDTKTGESGAFSYVSSWREHEIMFHVAPLMPSRDHDRQQVHRKRHLGNDIVCLVFMEGEKQTFDPQAIRSQFLHVYIVIHPETVEGKRWWRVEVVCNKNVKDFGPLLPSPPLFDNEEELGQFLILKLINAENAALQSDRFMIPNTKARRSLLQHLVETGLESTTIRTSLSSRVPSDGNLMRYGERPKSAGAQRTSRGSMRSLRAALESPPRPMTPDFPPVPSTSRSNMLRDLRALGRRRSAATTSTTTHSSSSASEKTSVEDGQGEGMKDAGENEDDDDTHAECHEKVSKRDESGLTQRVIQARHRLTHLKSAPRLTSALPGPPTPTRTTPTSHSAHSLNTSTSIRSRAQHLMTSVIGRRSSSRITLYSASEPPTRVLTDTGRSKKALMADVRPKEP